MPEDPKYPIITVDGSTATLTPSGWQSEDEFIQQMLEIDRAAFPVDGLTPQALDQIAREEVERWGNVALIVRLMGDSDEPD